ncbi:hypothetical protein ACJQWK_01699 [Exserohilum turcicum]|uniref:SCP domain-containing protein n=1 Tax=Exserohilum turcicum (strain 28A) TaxID=671987 RepID=R0K655_EXST2|nr:uncharacterized protein SETTUDRAFT_168373 [Exserohilum turcica Et28A]EOA88498.1 hypothetical protein SETTUDRAFT_168373 [Exserohilum turcica Et28A]
MRSALAFTIAALAGSALAAPAYGGYPAGGDNVQLDVVVETVMHTVYVVEGQPKPTTTSCSESTPTPSPSAPPANPPAAYEAVKPSPSPVYQAPPPPPPVQPSSSPSPTPTPAPAPSPSPSPVPQAPSADSYMGIVAEWRQKLGLKALEQSDLLESNAHKVVVDGNGVMRHELNPGTYGQVLAPGEDTLEGFKKVFVGGWLCEIPTLPGLNGVCEAMSEGWAYEGQTGHAEILTNPTYSKIGCNNLKGIWCCDLA